MSLYRAVTNQQRARINSAAARGDTERHRALVRDHAVEPTRGRRPRPCRSCPFFTR